MNSQQQEWLALGLALLIATVSIFRWLKKRRQGSSGCSHCPESSCGKPEESK